MRYAARIKPISYLKNNAAQVLLDLAEQGEPMVITQNGEARAVIQDVATYEATRQTLAMLKLLALGNRDVEAGRTRPIGAVVAAIRSETKSRP